MADDTHSLFATVSNLQFKILVVGHTTKHMTQRRTFVGHGNRTTVGWQCHTRAAPSCDIFNLRFVIFQCPTHYRASSVNCHLADSMTESIYYIYIFMFYWYFVSTVYSSLDVFYIINFMFFFILHSMLHVRLSYDQLWAASLIGRNAVTWRLSLSNDQRVTVDRVSRDRLSL